MDGEKPNGKSKKTTSVILADSIQLTAISGFVGHKFKSFLANGILHKVTMISDYEFTLKDHHNPLKLHNIFSLRQKKTI
jgi:hypothetical protein